MKPNVLDNVGDLFNDLYYIYKDKHNEEKDGFNTKNKKYFYYRKLGLTDDYQNESEEEEKEEKEQTSKKLDKRESLKKSAKDDWPKLKEWVSEKEKSINSEICQEHFRYRESSDMLRDLYRINDKKKNNDLVNLIKSGLSDLKNEIQNMDEEENEIEKPNEILLKRFLSSKNKIN